MFCCLAAVLLCVHVLQKRNAPFDDLTSKTYYKTYASLESTHYASISHARKVPFAFASFPSTETAICLVCPDLTHQAMHHAERLASFAPNATVFLLVDSVTAAEALVTSSHIFLISTGVVLPKKHGFRLTDGFNIKKEVHAWDKAYYLFAKMLLHRYKFVWFVEWDVFVPSKTAFDQLDASSRLALGSPFPYADLITAGNVVNTDGHTHHINPGETKVTPDWHWQRVKGLMPPPWHGSMMCIHGMSERLLERIGSFAAAKNRLVFIEAFAITLAFHHNLTVYLPQQLSSIVFKHSWTCADVAIAPLNIFHPVKNSTLLMNCSDHGP